MRIHIVRLVAVALVLVSAASDASALGVRQFCYWVPMRDGTQLATDVYMPRLPRGPYPVLLIRTPYGKHQIGKRQARLVCRQGYALAVQDLRACYQSEGDDGIERWFDGRDGHDTIRWLARQGWCDGSVGTFGPSALGFAENMLAPDAPSALRAQHVMMAFSNMYTQVVYQGGALRKALVEGWLEQNLLSPKNLETVLAHPRYDDFWAALSPETRAGRVNTPAVFWGGWHDAFLQGTINSFVSIQTRGGPRARGNCRLIVGPWDHDDIEWLVDPRKTKCLPAEGDARRFFDRWLKCRPNGVSGDRPVHYYVMGDRCDPTAPGNCWRSADVWPPPATPVKLYFHVGGRLRGGAAPTRQDSLSYRYDPDNPVPTVGGQNVNLPKGAMDQRPVESRGDVLIFTTDRLSRPVEVTGRILAKLYVASDCPDTDFTVKLTDVYPDGRSLLLADGILRARFRESFEREAFLEPGKVYPITVDLWSTSIVFNRGHRIRVAVSSSNAPRFQPNPNTGPVPRGSTKKRIAVNTLYLSKRYASHIVLPVRSGLRGLGFVSKHTGKADL